MTTKEQERAAVEKIRKIIEELGENSYVGFAMEGVLELAEENIREDTAYSMKKRAELIEERAREAEKENKLLKAELGTAKKITEENNKVIAKLKADVCELKANEVPEELIKEMYSMAYDKEAEMIEKMEKTADALKVFAAIAMIVNSREDSAKVKLTSVTRKTEKEEKRSA